MDANKTGRFKFLATAMSTVAVPQNKVILTTFEEPVLSNPPSDQQQTLLKPCYHEEADYHMMLHSTDTLKGKYKKAMIIATDTDVLVLAIATASVLPDGCQRWLAFGHGCNFRYISAHDIAAHLDKEWSCGLLFMPSLDVTPYLLSMAFERKLPGRYGDHFLI